MMLRLLHERRGVSAVEFALAAPILLAMMGGLIDLGSLWRVRGEVAAAVNAGAQYAVLAGSNATASNVQAAITAATTLTAVTVSATRFDGRCVSGSILVSPSSGGTCSDGSSASNYMQLSASYTYTPVMPAFSYVTATSLTERATVRLQ